MVSIFPFSRAKTHCFPTDSFFRKGQCKAREQWKLIFVSQQKNETTVLCKVAPTQGSPNKRVGILRLKDRFWERVQEECGATGYMSIRKLALSPHCLAARKGTTEAGGSQNAFLLQCDNISCHRQPPSRATAPNPSWEERASEEQPRPSCPVSSENRKPAPPCPGSSPSEEVWVLTPTPLNFSKMSSHALHSKIPDTHCSQALCCSGIF